MATSEKCENEPRTKLGFDDFSVSLEKHGGDTGSSQEAGSWGSSHLRRLRVGNVRTERYGPVREGRKGVNSQRLQTKSWLPRPLR